MKKSVLVKIGGKVAQEEERIRALASEMATLAGSARFVLVHGGGVQVTEISRKLGIEPVFRDGVRMTSEPEMGVVDMVLAGSVNKALVRAFTASGVRAVGVSGADGGLVTGRSVDGRSRTGSICGVDRDLLDVLLDADYLPVLCSVATDSSGGALNINADEMAFAVAAELACDDLLFVSDVPGVMKGQQVLRALSLDQAEREIADGTIQGGMMPKVKACLDAIAKGVGRVVIGDYRLSGDLARLLAGEKGTSIVGRAGAAAAGAQERLVRGAPFAKCFPEELLVLARGQGVRLEDVAGRRYLDFAGGIAVNALGYGRADLARVASAQMRKLVHVSNLFTTEPALELAAKLVSSGPFAAVQYQSSGTEANEAALKYARLYAMRTKGPGHHRLLSFTGSFHGRTMGALSCTPTPKYQEPFAPLVPGTAVCGYNDVAALRGVLDRSFAGVIVEVVQGEGGLDEMTPEFAAELNVLCRRHEVILIADEVQTGLSRTGALYASSLVGLEADIVTLAKPLAAGLPLAAVLLPAKVNDLIHAGEHGSTFAGGPVTTAVALTMWKHITDAGLMAGVCERGAALARMLEVLAREIRGLGRVKGRGLLRGIEVTAHSLRDGTSGADLMPALVTDAREAGLLVLRSGSSVLRFAPPLVITEAELAEGVAILKGVLERRL